MDTKIIIKQLLRKGKKTKRKEKKRKELRVLNNLIRELKLIYMHIFKIVYFLKQYYKFIFICILWIFFVFPLVLHIKLLYIYICVKD